MELYIKAPLTDKDALENVASSKLVKPTVPDEVAVLLVKSIPPLVYPAPATSPVVVKLVVPALNAAP